MSHAAEESSESHPPKRHGAHGGHGHGGGSHEEHEGAPEWLISFADNLALMMGFFVILLAMNLKVPTTGGIGGKEEQGGAPTNNSDEPSDEMLDMAIAIRAAFNNPVDPTSNDPHDAVLVKRLLDRVGPSNAIKDGPRGRQHDVQSIRPTDFYAVCGEVSFADQSTELSEAQLDELKDVAKHIRGRRQVVEVRGHCSAWEGAQDQDTSMRLAFERAMAVAAALADEGVDWWHLRIMSSGHHDRVNAFPDDAGEDLRNARVEVILTQQTVPDRVPMQAE